MTTGQQQRRATRGSGATVMTNPRARARSRQPGPFGRRTIPPVRTLARELRAAELSVVTTVERGRRERVHAVGDRLKEHSLGMLGDTISGVVSSVVIFIFGLVLFRIGFSSSPDFELDVLSPWSLFNSFKGLVLQLSTYQEYFLLGAVGVLLLLTILVTFLWLRDRQIDPDEERHWAARLAGPLSSLRTVSFLAVATLTVLGAFIYQEYLWHVALPIPHGAVGIAITRETAAASLQNELADALYTQGQSQQIVVRELPVNFNAGDTAKARALGKRIGAQAVIIYRAEKGANGKTQYIAYLVFTDPKQGLTIGTAPISAGSGLAAAQTAMVQVKQGFELPALTTNTLTDLANAAAGIIAYNDGRYRTAINHLELAAPKDPTSPLTGVLNFYLGRSLDFDNQSDAAVKAYEQTITYFDQLQKAGTKLGPRDELQYVEACLWRGRVAANNQQWAEATKWYQRALAVRDDLLARANDLNRPSDVRYTYSLLFSSLAQAYGGEGHTDDQQYWQARTTTELDAMTTATKPTDVQGLIDESTARFYSGDCAGAATTIAKALKLAPKDQDALNNAGIIDFIRGTTDDALNTFRTMSKLDPTSVSARQLIGSVLLVKGLALPEGYVEPTYLKQAEDQYQAIIRLDPTNIAAHDNIAAINAFLASSQVADLSAITSDPTAYAKSTTAWPSDPARRQAALDLYGAEITERRTIVTEMTPNDPEAQLNLAIAYGHRQQLLYNSLFTRDPKTDTTFKQDGQQVLTDSQPIMEWTTKVLDPKSGATRSERLQAWAVRLNSLDNVWGWYTFYVQDTAKSSESAKDYKSAVARALTLVEAAAPSGSDELTAAATIYVNQAFVALAIDNDQAGYQQAMAKHDALQQQLASSQAPTTEVAATTCVEQAKRASGDEALAKGDLPAAKTAYEAALASDPNLAAARHGLSRVLFQQGDTAGAIAQATTGTANAPTDPRLWQDLGLYQLAAGHTTAQQAAYSRFFTLVAALPSQQRMATLNAAIADLSTLLVEHPNLASQVRPVVPVFTQALDAIGAAGKGTYQYPALYGALGGVALQADDAATAEPLLKKALSLDPHQPVVRARLVIAIVAQGHDPAAAMTAAIKETQDKIWQSASSPDEQLAAMAQEVSAYVKLYPQRGAALQSFLQAIAAERDRLQQKAATPTASP